MEGVLGEREGELRFLYFDYLFGRLAGGGVGVDGIGGKWWRLVP